MKNMKKIKHIFIIKRSYFGVMKKFDDLFKKYNYGFEWVTSFSLHIFIDDDVYDNQINVIDDI